MVTTDRSLCFASAPISSPTWIASSRVGQSTSADGLRRPDGIRSSIGMPNAAVFPVPVFERTMTSLPAKIGPNVAAWTGVGVTYPRSATPRRTGSESFRSSNVLVAT